MSLFVEFKKRIRWMAMLETGVNAATLSACAEIPDPPLLPSIPKSESVTPLELSLRIVPAPLEFFRLSVVPNLPDPCSQIGALIEIWAAISIKQVPGGM